MSEHLYYKIGDGVLHLSDTRRDGYRTFHTDDLSHRWPWTGRLSIDIIRIEDKITLPPNSSGLFSNLASLTSIEGHENLDTSNVTAMNRMFQDCRSLIFVTTNDEEIISRIPASAEAIEPIVRAGRDASPSLGDTIGQAASACRAADEGHTGHSDPDPR